ncbi:MAG TPA: hypothetical protein VIK78_19735 [Ruminiclostridium sp.]
MAQVWESAEVKKQGDLWNAAKLKGDKAAMSLANTTANQLRNAIGYQSNTSGLNQTAKTGYAADSTNTKFTPTPVIAPPKIDNSGLIESQYGSLISALKSQIAQNVNNKNTEISGLGAKYQPQKNTSEVGRGNELRTALEISANNGDRGGIGRQQALETTSNADKRINDIGLQQTSDETNLRNDISNLLLEGNVQEAQFTAAKLKDLIANNQYVDTTNYNRGQDTFNNGIATSTLANNTASTNASVKNSEANTAGQLLQNKEMSDPNSVTNQMAKLGLNTARFNYSQLSVEAKQKADMVLNDLANGRMSRASAQSSIDHAGDSYAANMAQLAWQKSSENPDNAPKIEKPVAYNYKTDAGFADDMQTATNGGTTSVSQLKANASVFIQKYTIDGYNALLKAAQGE